MTSLSLLMFTVSTVFATSGDTGGTPYSAPASSPGSFGSSSSLEGAVLEKPTDLPMEGMGSSGADQPTTGSSTSYQPAEINDQISESPSAAPTAAPTFMDLPVAPLNPSLSDVPTKGPTSSPTFMDLDGDIGVVSVDVSSVTNSPSAAPIALTDPASQLPGLGMKLPTAAPIAAPLNPSISELPTAVPTAGPTFIDLDDAPLADPALRRLVAALDSSISDLPTAVPTTSPTFVAIPTEDPAPLNPEISESPTAVPTVAPTFIAIPTEDPAPLNPEISEMPTAVPTAAPTFFDLETQTPTHDLVMEHTLFEDYFQHLVAVLYGNKSCFTDLVDTISLISSCDALQTAIAYNTPCVIESVSDVDTFADLAKTVCGFVGPKYFAEMNVKRWFPTSASGTEWAPESWTGTDGGNEEGEQEAQIGSAGESQTVGSSGTEPVGSSL